MTLRNPNLSIHGESVAYANNVYEIEEWSTRPLDTSTEVRITLACYRDNTKANKISDTPWLLTGLTTNLALIDQTLLESELISQHGDKTLDGELISDFVVV
jgi:hypothetical protein